MVKYDTGGFAATSAPEIFNLREFESAGLRVVERTFKPRDTIFTPGDPDDQLYFLISGTIRIYKIYGEYKEATIALLKDEGIFGKLTMVEGRWQDVFAEAVTEAHVAGIPKSSLETIIQRRPDFAMKLFTAIAERLRQSDELVESLLHREVSSRLATLLLNLGERFGETGGTTNGGGGNGDHGGPAGLGDGERLLDFRLTHQELANMIASTREAVSKAMSEFQKEGVIEVRDRKIVILDPAALSDRSSRLPI